MKVRAHQNLAVNSRDYEPLLEERLMPLGLRTADPVAIDVALSDSRNAIARIYQQTLPRLRELPGSDVGSWIDAAVELKLELDHVAEHFHQASLELHKLTLELQDREGS